MLVENQALFYIMQLIRLKLLNEMKKEINHLKISPLSERQLLQMIASKDKQQAEEAFKEFTNRHTNRLYELCHNQTEGYPKDHKKKLAYSIFGSLVLYLFENAETLLKVIKGKRSSLSMQAAIFSHLEEHVTILFKDMLKDQWLDKEVYLSLPPKELRKIIDQSVYQDHICQLDELLALPKKDAAFRKDMKVFKKAFKTFKPKDRKFLIMMAVPILEKGKQHPEIMASVCQEFGITEETARQRNFRLTNRLKTSFEKEKKKN